ncbi:phage portal protein [Methylomonas sp. CM2]|uniref:phage portal protein n=1 Tax=Methylomonas sp. CM2 TaxID=3417647 RepID=UPI003CE9FA8E
MMNLFSFGAKPKRNRYDIALPPEPAPGVNNAAYGGPYTPTEFSDWMRGINAAAGVSVNDTSAMSISAVYACVALIGGTVASIPLQIYERQNGARVPVDHDYWWLFNEQPNPDYSASVLWESAVANLLLNGDGIMAIRRPKYGMAINGIEWFNRRGVTPYKSTKGLGLQYRCTHLDGAIEDFGYEDILHMAGPGFNGLHGMSQIRHVLRHSAGIALAADTFSAKYFENGARPDYALVHPGSVTPEQKNQILDYWEERHKGVNNAHRPAFLSGGADVKELSMNAEDAQLIATRQFQIEDIARGFGVPPHMIGHTQAATSWGTGIEQLSLGFLKFTMLRHLKKIEREINRKIWPNRVKYFAEFNTAALERGDYKTRMEGYRVALGRAGEPAFMRVSEIRKFENLPPDAELDHLAMTITQGASNASVTDQTASA